jgi:hypothetical protein
LVVGEDLEKIKKKKKLINEKIYDAPLAGICVKFCRLYLEWIFFLIGDKEFCPKQGGNVI